MSQENTNKEQNQTKQGEMKRVDLTQEEPEEKDKNHLRHSDSILWYPKENKLK